MAFGPQGEAVILGTSTFGSSPVRGSIAATLQQNPLLTQENYAGNIGNYLGINLGTGNFIKPSAWRVANPASTFNDGARDAYINGDVCFFGGYTANPSPYNNVIDFLSFNKLVHSFNWYEQKVNFNNAEANQMQDRQYNAFGIYFPQNYTELAGAQFIGQCNSIIGQPALAPVEPIISPWGGHYGAGSVEVNIFSRTTSAAIYYTIDGSQPSATNGTLYTGTFLLTLTNAQTILRAIAYDTSITTLSASGNAYSNVSTSFFYNYSCKAGDDNRDDKGIFVESKAGDFFYDGGKWYRYGMNSNQRNSGKTSPEVGYYDGINCYSSQDIVNNVNHGRILDNNDSFSMQRPHVLKCPLTGQYVMWVKWVEGWYAPGIGAPFILDFDAGVTGGTFTLSLQRNGYQQLAFTGSPTGGTFELQLQTPTNNFVTTSAITYSSGLTASTIQSNLAGLSNVGTGNVTVTGSNGGPFNILFNNEVPNIIQPVSVALTGGTSPGCNVSAITVTSSAITWSAGLTAATVQSAVAAMTNVGTGNVTVTGRNGGPFNVLLSFYLFTQGINGFTIASSTTGGNSYLNDQFLAAVATSDLPEAGWKYVSLSNPDNQYDATIEGYKDCNLFQDDNGTGYTIYTTQQTNGLNGKIVISQLSTDYLSTTGNIVTLPSVVNGWEGPALFKRNGVYFALISPPEYYDTGGLNTQQLVTLSGATGGNFTLSVSDWNIQTISFAGSPTGGTVMLNFRWQGVDVPILLNYSTGLTASTVQTALAPVVAMMGSDMSVSVSGSNGGPFTITFSSSNGSAIFNMMTTSVQSSNLTGGTSPTASIGPSTQTTGNIAYNASTSAVQTALQALSNISTNCSVTGSAGNWTVNFTTAFMPSLLVANTSGLTGSPAMSISSTDSPVSPVYFAASTIAGLATAIPQNLYSSGPGSTLYNCQVTKVINVAGNYIMVGDYWPIYNLYGSRDVFVPLSFPTSTTMTPSNPTSFNVLAPYTSYGNYSYNTSSGSNVLLMDTGRTVQITSNYKDGFTLG